MGSPEQQEQFLQAYDTLADALFRYCYFRLYDRERAKELAQEAFLKTWEHIVGEGSRDIENMRAFLYRVARNLVIDEARKKRTVSLDQLQEHGFDVPAETQSGPDIADAHRAIQVLGQLDAKYSEPLMLRYIEGWGPHDIARLLNENENVISVRINRGLKQLRAILHT